MDSEDGFNSISQDESKQALVDLIYGCVSGKSPIKKCSRLFKFQCPKTWDALTPTPERNIRFCKTCKHNVYLCRTLAEAKTHRYQCVALWTEEGGHYLGGIG